MFNGANEIYFYFIDISWRCIKKTLIGLISDNLLILKFRNSKFDLKDNFIDNLKNSNAGRFQNSHALK